MGKSNHSFKKMTSAQFRSEILKWKPLERYNGNLGIKELSKNGNGYFKSGNKYRNQIVRWSGIWRGSKVNLVFHSKKECNRGIELISLEKIGQIRNLDFQKSFLLIPKFRDERKAVYKCDAFYYDNELKIWVVEDTKSPMTRKLPTYKLKKKIFKWMYRDFHFKEV